MAGVPLDFTTRTCATARILEQRMDTVCAPFDLSWGELSVLVAMLADTYGQPVAPKELLERVSVSPAGLSNRLSRLEAKGLIQRSANEEDRRRMPVELTEEGRRRAGAASRACAEEEAAIMAALHGGHIVPPPPQRAEPTPPRQNERLYVVPSRSHGASGSVARGTDSATMRSREERWPVTGPQLERLQGRLARAAAGVEPFDRDASSHFKDVGAVFVSYGPEGSAPERTLVCASAVVARGEDVVAISMGTRRLHSMYRPGYLALAVGSLLEDIVGALSVHPDLIFVNGTGGDHDRGAGVAIHLGAACDVPTIGVTDRPLIAVGPQPRAVAGGWAPLHVRGRMVGCRVRPTASSQPITLHAGWRMTTELALQFTQDTGVRVPVPPPLLRARNLARALRVDVTTAERAS